MSKMLEDFKKALEKDAKDPNGYFNTLAKKDKLKSERFDRFELWMETNSLDDLMYRLIKENGKEWQDKCWNKGYQPYPTNLLSFVIDYAIQKNETVMIDDDPSFPTTQVRIKNFGFQTICGQGCFHRIFREIKGKWEFLEQI